MRSEADEEHGDVVVRVPEGRSVWDPLIVIATVTTVFMIRIARGSDGMKHNVRYVDSEAYLESATRTR